MSKGKVEIEYGALSAQGLSFEGEIIEQTETCISKTNVTVSTMTDMVKAGNDCYLEYGKAIKDMAENYDDVIKSFKDIDEKAKNNISRRLDKVKDGAIIG